MRGIVRVTEIAQQTRPAGHSTIPIPSGDYLGKIGIIWRPLINNRPQCYWVEFEELPRTVFADFELEELALNELEEIRGILDRVEARIKEAEGR